MTLFRKKEDLSHSQRKIKSAPKKKTSKRARRRFIYARAQELFKECPSRLARIIRAGGDWLEEVSVSPPIERTREFYGSLWDQRDQLNIPPLDQIEPQLNLDEILPFITVQEIADKINRTKQGVAAGPDGIRKGQISSKGDSEILFLLFNMLLCTAKQPDAWRINRTTLILKEGRDGNLPENYRPITVGSILSRLYWGIIDKKLRDRVKFNPRQKGFVAESGCFNNVQILNELISHGKRTSGIVVAQLDVSKAFDTIPHEAVRMALTRKGIPEAAANMIADSYKGMKTVIRCGSEHIEVQLKRGVKQGDPLSPFIFNAILEPLLSKLESLPGYKISEGQNISCLAFADDLILVATNPEQASELLRTTEDYLLNLGMSVAAEKSVCFQIRRGSKSWHIVDPKLESKGGVHIPSAKPDACLKYLGMRISPWYGVTTEHLREDMLAALHKVKRLALKPHQKIEFLSRFLIPQYLYQLILSCPHVSLLHAVDRDLRVVVKEILHLPQSTASGLIYAAKKDGGLGFPMLETIIVSASLKAGWKMFQSDDPAIRALAEGAKLNARMEQLARSARINWPISDIRQIDRYKYLAKKKCLDAWKELRAQGKAVQAFVNDKIGNQWLKQPNLLKPSRYITALQLRSNTAANRVTLHRANRQMDVKCRQCKAAPETLGHILGQCVATKALRIRRHDEIKDFIAEELSKDEEVAITKEPSIDLAGYGVLKPDLVIKHRGRVLAVDVTVRLEDRDYLARGHREKIEKYNRLLPKLKELTGAASAKVLPVVVGVRGAMPKRTLQALQELGITSRKALLTVSLMALRNSIEIYNIFMDYNRLP